MENYSINYLNNSFGHEFNENFVENFNDHEHHSSKTQYEIPLQGTMFEYDELGMSANVVQDINAWNHHHHQDNQSSYLAFPNYYENHTSTSIPDNMTTNASSVIQQYALPTDSLEFASNRRADLVPLYPLSDNNYTSDTSVMNEKSSVQFSCESVGCNKTYASLSGLNNHIKKKHSAAALLHCDECTATFMTSQQRTVHKIKEHNGRKYQPSVRQKNCIKDIEKNGKSIELNHQQNKCKSCDDTFNHKADLVRHMRNRHTGSGEYPCSKCSKVFFTFDMYNEHLSLHDESIPKHTCDDCGKEFISQRKLKEHSIIHQERIMFKCEMCSKIFVRSQTLQYHRITCKAAYQCSKCVDSFMTAEALEKHKSFHEADTHTCVKCNKVFPTMHDLQNHEKRHSLRMNYTCQICKESVSTRARFQKHIKDHLENDLKCSVCNEEFQSLVKYGYHKAEMHGLMRPYDCLLCSDQFCTRHELFMHLHNHIDVTGTYTCDLCGIKFSIKSTFEQHKKSHAKESEQSIVPSELTDANTSTQLESKIADDSSTKTAVAISSKRSSNDQNILCKADDCDETFTTHKQLKKHMIIHKLAAYNCPKCKKKYHSKPVYETHVRLCMPECEDVVLIADEDIDSGPMECSTCSQLFENKKILKFHQKICNDDGHDDEHMVGGSSTSNREIEEIYLKTEVEDELENLVPEF